MGQGGAPKAGESSYPQQALGQVPVTEGMKDLSEESSKDCSSTTASQPRTAMQTYHSMCHWEEGGDRRSHKRKKNDLSRSSNFQNLKEMIRNVTLSQL